jgi:glycosyltransferase involved in cell wall biosynthesis
VNVVSAGFLTYVRKISPDGDYRLFTNGIDDEFLSAKFEIEDTQPKQPPMVLYAGNMGEGQGLHHIIPEAARRLGDSVHFRLIGDGGRRLKLESAVAREGARNVEILDPVPRGDLFDHYREATILFLHLNDYAAFRKVLPSKIFEYAATGKPILAGVAGYSASFLRNEVIGAEVFAPCDVTGMVEAIQRLIEGPAVFARKDFCDRFARSQIMREMARDVLELELKLAG